MSVVADVLMPSPGAGHTARLAGRLAWREFRGGLRGFGVFIACIALGVLAIAGVGSVAASLADGVASAGQAILGGDLAFTLIQRESNDAERAFFDRRGTQSVIAMTRAMARTADGRSTLVEVKAVDTAYPLFGVVATDPPLPLPALFAPTNGAFGAAVDPALLSRLDLKIGDRITIGNATIELRAALTSEPDRLAGGIGFGPRLLIGEAALHASTLIQPGSLVRWLYRLRLPSDTTDAAVAAVEKEAQAAFPDAGWEIRTRSKASPQLDRNVERFTQFLTLVGLTTLLVGGVGVANAVTAHLTRKRDAIATMAIARRLPRARSAIARLAIANIHRPGSLTPTVVISLGLGLALLVTLIELNENLHRQFTAALPEKAPSFFFLGIPAADGAGFDAFIREHAPASTLERVPMLRGRIVAANGIKAEALKPAAGSRWVLQGDRGITFASVVPAGSRIVDGQWWAADYSGEPLVSLESRTAHDLDLGIGQSITVNVLGRNVTARIANLREVDWENLGINFVLVFSPGTFAGAPHSDIATLTFADGGTTKEETAVIKALAGAYPTVSAVYVKDALSAFDGIINKLVLALGGASSLTLIAAALVLGGALAAGQRFRIYDAVVLKTYGATRAQLIAAFALEYLGIGLVTVLFGVAMGTLAAGLIVTRAMEFPFAFFHGQAAAAALAALAVTLALGLAGTLTALGRKPAEVLRSL